MRLQLLAPVTLAIAVFSGCMCADTVKQTRFACNDTAECLPDSVCRGGECRAEVIPEGVCFEGETQACTPATCARPCGADGGWQACAPATGAGFDSNPLHCGECGRACSTRLGASLTCIDSHCTCATDLDCPSGDVCAPGGVCVMNTDPCARLTCAAGSVCRLGACTPVACASGCGRGEVCDLGSSLCRPILPCRLAEPCGDGGLCEGATQPDGEPCNDGVSCTTNDACSSGACQGTAYSCPAPSQCQQAVACAGDGGCDVTPVLDGTPCDDGVACTANDQCVAGACGGSAYSCTPTQCAATSECAGDGGCTVTPRNTGATCDDNQPCSFGDSCNDAGVCAGTVYSCPGVTACKQAGLCLGDGGCDVVDKPNGTTCDDGVACTSADSCTSGVCGGTALTSYQDSDGDGLGNAAVTQAACPLAAGYVLDAGDCNDSSAFVKTVMAAVADVDQDGVTSSTSLNPTACVGASSVVNGRTYYRNSLGTWTWLAAASVTADCNDTDPDVFTSRPTMVTDADHDGYSTGVSATTCVGASMVFNGRTSYANTAGAFIYLDASAALGSGDCNDASASVFPQTYYQDTDGDGRGALATGTVQCPAQVGWISNNTDCNDTNGSIYQTVALLYDDADQDGYSNSAAASICVGTTTTVGGRTYYRGIAGTFSYTTTFLGADCNTGSSTLFATQTNVVPDDDRDGYPSTATATTQCTGATSTQGGRTYFADGTGGYWMGRTDCIERQGSGCDPGFIDCYDLNASAAYGQTAYFTTDRGDGSFDYNCSGMIGANSGSAYCASTSAGVPVFTDGTCGTGAGTATICNTPTAFAVPGACGKNTAGGATFTNPGVCTAETLATATLVGCR